MEETAEMGAEKSTATVFPRAAEPSSFDDEGLDDFTIRYGPANFKKMTLTPPKRCPVPREGCSELPNA